VFETVISIQLRQKAQKGVLLNMIMDRRVHVKWVIILPAERVSSQGLLLLVASQSVSQLVS
jgi:hypothetical protein